MKPLHAGDAYVSLDTTTALNTVIFQWRPVIFRRIFQLQLRIAIFLPMHISTVGLNKPFNSVLLKVPSGNSSHDGGPVKVISLQPLHDAFLGAPQPFQWRADSTGVFPLYAITSIAPTTSVSVAPNCLDKHPVLLSSHFPSLEQCYIPRGRFFECISVVPIYSCTRPSREGEFRLILNPFQRVPVALTFLCAVRFTRVPFQCAQLTAAFHFTGAQHFSCMCVLLG